MYLKHLHVTFKGRLFLLMVSIYTVDSRYLEFDGTMEKIRVNRSSTQRSYENTGSVVCLTTKGRQLKRNSERHVGSEKISPFITTVN